MVIHRWPVDSPHKGPVTRKMFPFDDVIMNTPSIDIKKTSWHGNALRITGPLRGESTAHRWYFLWCYPEQAVEQTIDFPVIWDAMPLIWCHWNNYGTVINCYTWYLNSSPPSAAFMRQWTGSSLVKVMACRYLAPSHNLNQWWIIVNWTPRNKFQWNFNQNTHLFIHDNASENIVCDFFRRPFCPGRDELTCINKRQDLCNFYVKHSSFYVKCFFFLLNNWKFVASCTKPILCWFC